MTFSELAIPPDLVAALARTGITIPTAIQSAALPPLLAGSNAYLHAETGTGKTLAYLLPLYCRIDPAVAGIQAVILAPTHELAIQIHRQAVELAQHAGRALRVVLLIGGTPLDRQIDKLKKKPHLVVGSPGRMRELLEMRKLKFADVRSLVVDEADRLLDGESTAEVRVLIDAAPVTRQLIFASATENPALTAGIREFAPALALIQTATNAVNPGIAHYYVQCAWRDKPEMVRKLYHALLPTRTMIFVHRNDTARQVASLLNAQKIPVADLSSAAHKLDRQQAMDDFRSGRVRVLLTSDVGARGLDIKDVAVVVNLDPPAESKAYLHRVGRTGRAGAPGTAITLVSHDELKFLERYRAELGITVGEVGVRDGRVTPLEDLLPQRRR